MILQTNSYIVPKEKRAEHSRLLSRFRQSLARHGCDHFEVYEQVGAQWGSSGETGRFVQIMRFRDRRHQQQVQAAELADPTAQALIKEFCELINFAYQQQHGLFMVGYYNSVLAVSPGRVPAGMDAASPEQATEPPAATTPEPPDLEPPPLDNSTGNGERLDLSMDSDDLPDPHPPASNGDEADRPLHRLE